MLHNWFALGEIAGFVKQGFRTPPSVSEYGCGVGYFGFRAVASRP